jgi:LysR family transcriptional regulator, regulator for bpeEF and oprC
VPPTIQSIRTFVRVVETNSFKGAAHSLLIDPAVVSRTIKTLEGELGVLLFVRSTRTMKLTPEGSRFYQDSVRLLERYEEATQQFQPVSAIPHGRINVGIAPALAKRIIVRAIGSFVERYPKIEIVLVNVEDLAQVEDKNVEVLIRGRSLRQRGGQHPDPQGLVARKLFASPLILCASPGYLDRAGTPRTPADLAEHTCVGHFTIERDFQDEWPLKKAHARKNVKFAPTLLVQGAEALRETACAGIGIVRTRAANVEEELRSRTLKQVLSDWECGGSQPIVAIYRKTRPMPPRINLLVQHLVTAFRRYNQLEARNRC